MARTKMVKVRMYGTEIRMHRGEKVMSVAELTKLKGLVKPGEDSANMILGEYLTPETVKGTMYEDCHADYLGEDGLWRPVC